MINFFGSTSQSHLANGDNNSSILDTKVIIVAGQSNAGGEQYALETLPSNYVGALAGVNRIFQYQQLVSHSNFSIVNDSNSLNVGPDLSMGRLYQQFTNENIYIIKYAWGGTALSQNANPNWNIATGTTNSLFQGLKDCVNTAMSKLTILGLKPTISGFIWYQGEEDAFQNQSTVQYRANEYALLNQFKTDMSLPNLKIYSVLISRRGGIPDYYDRIRQAKIQNSAVITNYNLVDSDGLTFDTLGEGYHLLANSQIELGRRIFELLKFN
ncbi:hypothetical protein ABIB62_004058 [Mucilaginibacter sp. UYP25]|uniref:sialate O-acetylesterase n=1 Tax=unclassified Mucilaginibacter TaxID=2617802 RepID=UPI0033979B7C